MIGDAHVSEKIIKTGKLFYGTTQYKPHPSSLLLLTVWVQNAFPHCISMHLNILQATT